MTVKMTSSIIAFLKLHLALSDELGQLGCDHENAPHAGDERDEHERLRHQDVLAEGKLDGVE